MSKNQFQLSLIDMGLFDDNVVTMEEHVTDLINENTRKKKSKEEDSEEEINEYFDFNIILGDQDNVHQMFPFLRSHQAEDTADAERRFKEHKGKLFTNGTGVGKSHLGCSIASRFYYRGLQSILVVVPTDKKVKDWISTFKDFKIQAKQIESVSSVPLEENGKPGVVITTFANFYQNEDLLKYHFNFIIYDESHYLMSNGQGKDTVYMNQHRRVARLPSDFRNMMREDENWTIDREPAIRQKLLDDYCNNTKVLFLSASPFAYHESLMIGDGTLWNVVENYDVTTDNGFRNYRPGEGSYNNPSAKDSFFIENLGYRMRYGKLTIPEAEVDISLLERQFFERQVKEGAISGRQINVDFDYSREFLLLDSEVGEKIDEGISVIESQEFQKQFPFINKFYENHFTYIYKNQLLESIKTKLIIPRVKEHLELGRKVVVFHDYNNQNPKHPFRFDPVELLGGTNNENYWKFSQSLIVEIQKFNQEYPELYGLDITEDLSNPITEFQNNFGSRCGFFNGKTPKKLRGRMKDAFQDDLSGLDIILVQRQAGQEGIDLHDTTGKFQRVLIDLGLPIRPTSSIQCEGRIYRDGLASNSIYEYATIQTIFERVAFAEKISIRASTAENLAMGNKARNLKNVFIDGYNNSDWFEPHLEQGYGGKEQDRNLIEVSEFDIARSYYYSQLKKNSKNKAKEGVDYFATPEPLGYKMYEWLHLEPGNLFLEPSAGHGAIARFCNPLVHGTVIEPSRELMSKAKINCGDIKRFEQQDFESFSYMNKYNGIAMNPPFGTNAKTALNHLEKALVEHSYYNNMNTKFRLLAIVPDGQAVQKWVDNFHEDHFWEKWDEKKFKHERNSRKIFFDSKKVKISGEILLPSCTFERAGTKVMCKILIFDSINHYNEGKSYKKIDLRYCKDINEFFEEIEHLSIPDYIPKREIN